MTRLLIGCMEILFLKLAATIFWPGLIALPLNTLPIDGWQFFGGFRALFLLRGMDKKAPPDTYLRPYSFFWNKFS